MKVNNNNLKVDNESRFKVSSKGKRLFSLLLDFILALLVVNTISQITKKEHWDLVIQSRNIQDLIPFYGSIILILLFKDILGRSLGKVLLGMKICLLNDFSKSPSFFVLVSRNLFLLIFPLESFFLLRDGYARRFADKLYGTVVIDKKDAMRPILRIFLGNIILFGFFTVAILFQQSNIEKSAAYQIAEEAIRNQAVLEDILKEFPSIEEPEIHLDLRQDQRKNSVVRVRVGDEELGNLVKVYLKLQSNPNNWEVVDVTVESIEKSKN